MNAQHQQYTYVHVQLREAIFDGGQIIDLLLHLLVKSLPSARKLINLVVQGGFSLETCVNPVCAGMRYTAIELGNLPVRAPCLEDAACRVHPACSAVVSTVVLYLEAWRMRRRRQLDISPIASEHVRVVDELQLHSAQCHRDRLGTKQGSSQEQLRALRQCCLTWLLLADGSVWICNKDIR